MRAVPGYGQNWHAGSPVVGARLAVHTGGISQEVGSVLPASAKGVSGLVLWSTDMVVLHRKFTLFYRQCERTAVEDICSSAAECMAVTENGKSSLSTQLMRV